MSLDPATFLRAAERELEAMARSRDRLMLSEPLRLATHLSPTFQPRAHLRKISHAVADMAQGSVDRLLITTPPQVGKSTIGAVWAPYWWLARRPSSRIIVASYASSLAITRGRSIRKLVVDHGESFGLRLDMASRSAADWYLTTGGGIRSVGVGGSLTGYAADAMIIDDPHKDRASADSLKIREAVYGWYSSVALTRLAPKAPLVMILTRWHPDDLAGRVLADEGSESEGGRWRVLHMPAVAVSDADILGRTQGDPLTHPLLKEDDTDGLSAHWADKRASSTVRDWHALFMGDPQPAEGALLTGDILRRQRYFREKPDKTKIAVAVDPSGGGRDTAGIIGGYLGSDGKLYFTHDRSGKMPSEQWARTAVLLAEEIDADRIIIETNFGGDMALLMIRTAYDALRREGRVLKGWMCPRLVKVVARRGKLLRAEPIAQQWQEDYIRTGAYLPELEAEWCSWQPDDPDSPGRIDASVHLAYGLLKVPGSGRQSSSPARVDRSQVGRSSWPEIPR